MRLKVLCKSCVEPFLPFAMIACFIMMRMWVWMLLLLLQLLLLGGCANNEFVGSSFRIKNAVWSLKRLGKPCHGAVQWQAECHHPPIHPSTHPSIWHHLSQDNNLSRTHISDHQLFNAHRKHIGKPVALAQPALPPLFSFCVTILSRAQLFFFRQLFSDTAQNPLFSLHDTTIQSISCLFYFSRSQMLTPMFSQLYDMTLTIHTKTKTH